MEQDIQSKVSRVATIVDENGDRDNKDQDNLANQSRQVFAIGGSEAVDIVISCQTSDRVLHGYFDKYLTILILEPII